jgi:tungstate transport system permease protein
MEFLLQGFFKAIDLLATGDPETFAAVKATLVVSAYSLAAALACGLPLGFCLGYFDFPLKQTARTLVETLLALPTVFIGLVVYALFTRRGPLGSWGLLFTLPGIAVGLAILAFPIVTALSAAAVEATERRLRATLISLGANRRQLFLSTLWEARHGISAAGITAFGRVMTEVGIAMMVGGNIKWQTRTMTTAIALETNQGEFAMGVALGLLLLALAFAVNLAVSALRRRS